MFELRQLSALLGVSVIALSCTGCAGRNQQSEEAFKSAGNAVAKTATDAGNALKKAGQVTSITTKVKSALLTTPKLNAGRINVDTLVGKKSVALRGSVRSADEKALAVKVAKAQAAGYTIIDQLQVR